MIGKIFKYKGIEISKTTADFRVGITSINWLSVDTSDEIQNIAGYHGIKMSPTFLRGRRIIIEGIIVADSKEGSSKGIDYVRNLFSIQSNLDILDLNTFEVIDEQNRNWKIETKVKEAIEIEIGNEDYRIGENRMWRIVLQAEDPKFYGDEFIFSTKESAYGGYKLPMKLPKKLDDISNKILIVTSSSFPTDLIFTIKITGEIDLPLLVENKDTRDYFGIDNFEFQLDDIIVLNSEKKSMTLTRNGETTNILSYRKAGSTWLKAINGNIFFVNNGIRGMEEQSRVNVSVKWKNIYV